MVHRRDRGGSRDDGGVVAAELYGGVHGGRALAHACSAKGEGGSACTLGGRRDMERSQTRTQRGRGTAVELGRAASVHGDHTAFRRTPGGQQLGEGGTWFGPDLGRIRHWAQNEV